MFVALTTPFVTHPPFPKADATYNHQYDDYYFLIFHIDWGFKVRRR
jgi:hypothetical protein